MILSHIKQLQASDAEWHFVIAPTWEVIEKLARTPAGCMILQCQIGVISFATCTYAPRSWLTDIKEEEFVEQQI